MNKFILGGVLAIATFATAAVAQDQSYPQTPVQNGNSQSDPQYGNPQNGNPQYGNPQYGQQNGSYNQQYGPSMTIPAGTNLAIRADQDIKAQDVQGGDTYQAEIAQDVKDPNGNIIIPRGAPARLVVVDSSYSNNNPNNYPNNPNNYPNDPNNPNNPNNYPNNNTSSSNGKDLSLALQSVNVNGRDYYVQSNTVGGSNQKMGGIGANKRTGKYVGGGALIGTVIGAIAGGGKGAAIGAAVGAAGGAGAQVLTRGKQINVPAETVLTFRLDQPLMLQQ